MIYGSVCSGIEAATVAWEPLGWKAAWFAEIEAFPCAVQVARQSYVCDVCLQPIVPGQRYHKESILKRYYSTHLRRHIGCELPEMETPDAD